MGTAENEFQTIANRDELDSLFVRSHDGPVLLFKHSNACPISSAAYQQMSRVKRYVGLVVVQQNRDVSREVESRTGVRHESPQALIIRDGAAVWTASHFGVTTDAVERALDENS